MVTVSVVPQTSQVCSCRPSSSHFGAVMTVNAPQVWPFAGIATVSFSPQTSHTRSLLPSSVQVGSFVTVNSPQRWPFAGMRGYSPSMAPQSAHWR